MGYSPWGLKNRTRLSDKTMITNIIFDSLLCISQIDIPSFKTRNTARNKLQCKEGGRQVYSKLLSLELLEHFRKRE